MIGEMRRYTLHPGLRETFIRHFEEVNRAALRDAGMLVFGPMRDLEDPDRVHWMRAFESLEQREALKQAFYDSPIWTQDAAPPLVMPLVMPLIAHFEASLVATTEDFQGFDQTASL
ncbi:putative quinol monooxygenase [Pseudophaeobacter arcticus]|jgi:quinol monooxygenase YgiN|uniref:putative quinol monooxygenase n=2 Tax=Pseudophaeobacter arcticus TaxID=385492 RepID=UPI0039E4B7AB